MTADTAHRQDQEQNNILQACLHVLPCLLRNIAPAASVSPSAVLQVMQQATVMVESEEAQYAGAAGQQQQPQQQQQQQQQQQTPPMDADGAPPPPPAEPGAVSNELPLGPDGRPRGVAGGLSFKLKIPTNV